LGRSRGGLSTKIHALVQGMGQLIGFALTGGEAADITQAQSLLCGRDLEEVVADKGYDSDELVQFIRNAGAKAVIPPRSNRLHKRRWDRQAYKDRNLIERFFCRLKQFRRIATRYDKLAERYASIVTLGASFVWLSTEL
jgi:transposase